ncbi:MAG: SWIM zinc finger family protein [Smithellaceae bacterium]|nr:SWIM zinc finger family protein [Smithellaceae bacterium]
MSILDHNRQLFPIIIRERGSQYCERGRVDIDYADDTSVMAEVQGSEIYDVEVEWKDGFLCVACTCPYAEKDYCKHIYAVLLNIERANLLSQLQYLPNVHMKLVLPEDLFDDDFEDNVRTLEPPHLTKSVTPPLWDVCLDDILTTFTRYAADVTPVRREAKEIVYIIRQSSGYYDPSQIGDLVVNIHSRSRKKNGEWGQIKPLNGSISKMAQLDSEDTKIVSVLTGAQGLYDYSRSSCGSSSLMISRPLAEVVLPAMSDSGRLFFQNDRDETLLGPLKWHPDEVWTPSLNLRPDTSGDQYNCTAELNSPSGAIPVTEPLLIARQGVMIVGKRVCRIDDLGAFPWIEHLRKQESLTIPKTQIHDFIEKIYSLPGLPPLLFPEELRVDEVETEAQACLVLRTHDAHFYCQDKKKFRASLYFLYRDCPVAAFPRGRGFYSERQGCYMLRNADVEKNADQTLLDLGFKAARNDGDGATHEIDTNKFARVVSTLTAGGWHIEADGKFYREAGSFSLNITTGIDWFELHGTCDFENQKARLPALLAALKKKENLVALPDGTFGVIPEAVLKKYALLAEMGEA